MIEKLCEALTKGGVLLFTAGGVEGEVRGEMCGETFYYSSLSAEEYLKILNEKDCKCILLQRDQYPDEHVVFIAAKN